MCKQSQIILTDDILKIIGPQTYQVNNVGMSESEVRIYDKYVLKIQPNSVETDNEYLMVKWLNHQIPTPSIPVYSKKDGVAYTLMTKVEGDMLCAKEYMKEPEVIIKIVAQAIKMLWEIDVKKCPYKTSRLDNRLRVAEYNVANGLVDMFPRTDEWEFDSELLSIPFSRAMSRRYA